MQGIDQDTLLTAKELAAVFRVNVDYIYRMRKRGFVMPARLATVREARTWLALNPSPYSAKNGHSQEK